MYNKEHISVKALGTRAITVTTQCKVTPETKSLFSATYERNNLPLVAVHPSEYSAPRLF